MPALPQTFEDRMRRLESAVRVLSGRANIRPALDEVLAGTVRIGEGGTLRVEAPTGEDVMTVGRYSDGTYGTYMERGDGTGTAFRMGPGPGPHQVVQMYARGATEIVADDPYYDGWLGRPYVHYPMPESVLVSDWPSTTATFWTTVGISYATRQHMALTAFGDVAASPGTTGQMRVVVDGTQIGAVASAPANGFGTLSIQRANLPAGVWGQSIGIELQLQRTSGTGAVSGHLLMLQGVAAIA